MRTSHWIALSAAALLSIALPVAAQQTTEKHKRGGADSANTDRERDMVKQMQSHGMTLAKAIAAAETNTGGTAVAARAHHEDKNVMIDVDCVVGDKVVQASVDSATGKVTQSPKTGDRHRNDKDRKEKKGGERRSRGGKGDDATP